MAILQALIASLTRSAGKLLNTVFAWATVLLFGRVSENRQIYVSAIAFASVIWLVLLVGIAFPAVGTVLLSFVPLPDWIDKKWIRIAMLAGAVILPALVGVISILMLETGRRPRGVVALAKAVAKGYPYTVGLAVTLVMMTLFAPIMKVRMLAKRWTSEHVPVIIESHDYPTVVDATQQALERGGIRTERQAASWMLRAPTKILTFFARGVVSEFVADEMAVLRSNTIEVLLHPSDVVISGPEGTAAHARSVLAEHLVFTAAYLTWDKEANEIEDRLRSIWDARQTRPPRELRNELKTIEHDLHQLEVDYEEWEVLFREFLLVQRAVADVGAYPASLQPSWSTTVAAGVVVAAPHLARAADSLEDTADHVRKTAKQTGAGAALLSTLSGLIGTIAALATRVRRPPRSGAPAGKPRRAA